MPANAPAAIGLGDVKAIQLQQLMGAARDAIQQRIANHLLLHHRPESRATLAHGAQDALRPFAALLKAPVLCERNGLQHQRALLPPPALRDLLPPDKAVKAVFPEILRRQRPIDYILHRHSSIQSCTICASPAAMKGCSHPGATVRRQPKRSAKPCTVCRACILSFSA